VPELIDEPRGIGLLEGVIAYEFECLTVILQFVLEALDLIGSLVCDLVVGTLGLVLVSVFRD
jgi:hypothetical protein